VDGVPNGLREGVRMRDEIRTYVPGEDPEGVRAYWLLSQISTRVDDEMGKDLRSMLREKAGLDGESERSVIKRNVDQSLDMIFDPSNGAFKYAEAVPMVKRHKEDEGAWFGKDDYKKGDPIIDRKTGKPEVVLDENGNVRTELKINEAAKWRSINERAKIEMKMGDWIRLNPTKAQDVEQVQKKLKELIPEGTQAAAWEALKKKLPPPPLPRPQRVKRGDALTLELPDGLPSPGDNPLFNIKP
jgi:hypothetical protein